jgi:hypothetical protein
MGEQKYTPIEFFSVEMKKKRLTLVVYGTVAWSATGFSQFTRQPVRLVVVVVHQLQ